nr:DUF1330 domain-containing protein [uncultured Allomuricauda sp.]
MFTLFSSPAQLLKEMKQADKPTTLIVTSTANPYNKESLKQYVDGVMPMFYSINGEVIKRSKLDQILFGNKIGEFLLVMDFPSKRALLALFESEEYRNLLRFRKNGFLEINIWLADDLK